MGYFPYIITLVLLVHKIDLWVVFLGVNPFGFALQLTVLKCLAILYILAKTKKEM